MWWNYIQTPHEARAEKCVKKQDTLHYNGQFALSLGEESPFSLKSTRFIFTDTFYGPLRVRINLT